MEEIMTNFRYAPVGTGNDEVKFGFEEAIASYFLNEIGELEDFVYVCTDEMTLGELLKLVEKVDDQVPRTISKLLDVDPDEDTYAAAAKQFRELITGVRLC